MFYQIRYWCPPSVEHSNSTGGSAFNVSDSPTRVLISPQKTLCSLTRTLCSPEKHGILSQEYCIPSNFALVHKSTERFCFIKVLHVNNKFSVMEI